MGEVRIVFVSLVRRPERGNQLRDLDTNGSADERPIITSLRTMIRVPKHSLNFGPAFEYII
jgi:hypothetical protein